ncbi:sugar kinase, xylulose kinase [Actinobaculum suis]|uniref:Sugar kinase, xylulose kinase n=1 Tax=Actinobaculum suis TaxID=1657 RepID=A0A7Z8YA85_9ACTO|nr:FGGY-family carbohydrate kinase [Actinobaculum suis]VDG77204.1 sugar kinase, xylulose kinase [Actinobaculum suis]
MVKEIQRPGPAAEISAGQASLGIEFGSTRIKACIVSQSGTPLATGAHEWENEIVDGHWSYPLASVQTGMQAAYADLLASCEERYGVAPRSFAGIGVSAMMHGYLAFDAAGELLVPFRTWRDTTTAQAAAALTERFGVNIPMRWSVAHLYQAMLDGEEHVSRIDFLTTLAGYVHWQLTGRKVLGVGDASGMFPIAANGAGYDPKLLASFQELITDLAGSAPVTVPRKPLGELLPQVLLAGEEAGRLTASGAAFLDPSGTLEPGVLCAPPEGDAGTGMVVTNAVRPRTGNVSVGTSIFLMAVLERPLRQVHREIDPVTTPTGEPVAMVHCNNGADELAMWMDLFREVGEALGGEIADPDAVYRRILPLALEGEPDGGGLLAFNNISGEPVTGLESGRPGVLRAPGCVFTLPNFMRSQVFSTFAALALGLEVLATEDVELDVLSAHGGVFRTPGVAQRLLAAAADTPITVAEGAAEGGAWGMAILAAFAARENATVRGSTSALGADPGQSDAGQRLQEFLSGTVFAASSATTITPSATDREGFAQFLETYRQALPVQETAVNAIAERVIAA